MSLWNTMVLVGTIARPHGLRGLVLVNPQTDFVDERFRPGEALWIRRRENEERLVVESVRLQNGRPLVGFEGYGTLEAVAPLAGCELRVPEDTLRELPAGVFYHHQLVGCAVETVAGIAVGRVIKVDEGAGGALLVVAGQRGEVLVPLAADICPSIDVVAQRIRIEPPPGLLELNEPTAKSGASAARGDRSRRD